MFPVFIVPFSMRSHSPNKEEEKPKENAEEEKKEEKKPKDDSPRPRPLHKTCSLFMRSIAPTISKAEIIAVSCTQVVVLMTQKMTRRAYFVSFVSFKLNIHHLFFSLSFAGDTLAFCVFACLTLIQSEGWFKRKKPICLISYFYVYLMFVWCKKLYRNV